MGKPTPPLSMWSNISVDVRDLVADGHHGSACTETTDGDVIVISFSITDCDVGVADPTKRRTSICSVPKTIEGIVRSCNLQHNTTTGGEFRQLLLDYDRCSILLDGAHEPTAHDFVRRIEGAVGVDMTRHVVALCTQGVLADFLELATRRLHARDPRCILVDHSRTDARSFRYRVHLRDTDRADVFVQKQLSIFALDDSDSTPLRQGSLTMDIHFAMQRGAYVGSYTFLT